MAKLQTAIGQGRRIGLALMLVAGATSAGLSKGLFDEGAAAYRAGDFSGAAECFRAAAQRQAASGTLQNLGNAEWQSGNIGAAVLAWERATWVDPFNRAARDNLRFARKTAQLETPELAWYEVVSTWLPVTWWAWVTGTSLWVAIGMVMLPGLLRRRKAGWHQAVAALALMVFLLSVPAQAGVHTRARIGFVLRKDTPLRLTPTLESQPITHLSPGEPLRWERVHGNYVLARTSRTTGWLQKQEFELVAMETVGK